MPSVHVTDLTFSYSSAATVLRGIGFDLGPGWAGLVGANGSGKTTLLSLLSGALRPDSGAVLTAPPEAAALLCPQRVDDPDAGVTAFARSWDAGAARLRGVLGLEPDQPERWGSLSPGERKRWQIGAALAADPDVLLLDEPTNHLDGEGRARLLDALHRFRGVGVVVSHDRRLLDDLTTTTLRLHRGEATAWSGGYSQARAAWEAAEADERDRREAARREEQRAARLLDRAVRDRASAEAEMRRGQHAGIKDPDSRGAAQTGRRAAGEARAGRRVHVRRAAVERARERVAGFEASRDPGGAVAFDHHPAPKEWLVRLELDALVAGDTVLVGPVSVGVRRTDRIWVTGRNGAGKSTLLAALVRAAAVPRERLLWLPQEMPARQGAALLEEIRALPGDRRGALLALVARLGVDPGRLLESEVPSPGEARKVAMAHGLAGSAWLVVLDEPTNHLDLPSIERIEEALAAYAGALVVVTHDDRLGAAVTEVEWALENGVLEVRPGAGPPRV